MHTAYVPSPTFGRHFSPPLTYERRQKVSAVVFQWDIQARTLTVTMPCPRLNTTRLFSHFMQVKGSLFKKQSAEMHKGF
ncbi:MAG: hypothetical protein ACLUFV_01995 [Acutalibacteraceae bacterium]